MIRPCVLALSALLSALLGLGGVACGQEVPAKVDFSKPPNKVEGYNKARFKVEPWQDGDKGLVLRVSGQAYYPDGVVFAVAVRYWRQTTFLTQKHAKVKGRAFSVDLGPLPKTIPEGALTVEAWFALAKQPKAARRAMEEGKFFSCSPPCQYDRLNVTRTDHVMGGAEGQARAEKAEKKVLSDGLQAVLAARSVAEKPLLEARTKMTPGLAKAALVQLEEDLDAALEPGRAWRNKRQFVLFAEQASALQGLAYACRVEARCHAAVSGVKGLQIEAAGGGSGRVDPFNRYAGARQDAVARVDAFKGFLAEEKSVDRLWHELGEQAKAKAKAAEARRKKEEGE
jgi:hypothetical protein